MSMYVVRQPDGKLAVYSTSTEDFAIFGCTEEEVLKELSEFRNPTYAKEKLTGTRWWFDFDVAMDRLVGGPTYAALVRVAFSGDKEACERLAAIDLPERDRMREADQEEAQEREESTACGYAFDFGMATGREVIA